MGVSPSKDTKAAADTRQPSPVPVASSSSSVPSDEDDASSAGYHLPTRQEVDSMQTPDALYFEISRNSCYQQYQARRLHFHFKQRATDGRLMSLSDFTAAFFPHSSDDWCCAPSVVRRAFQLFDRDGDGVLAFNDLIAALTICYSGTKQQQIRFLFDVYDAQGKGYLDRADLARLLSTSMPYLKGIEPRLLSEALTLREIIADGQHSYSWYQQQLQALIALSPALPTQPLASPVSPRPRFSFRASSPSHLNTALNSQSPPLPPVQVSFDTFYRFCLSSFRYRRWFSRFHLLPSVREERAAVRGLVRDGAVVKGEEWYVLDGKWWRQWCTYCKWDETEELEQKVAEDEEEEEDDSEESEDEMAAAAPPDAAGRQRSLSRALSSGLSPALPGSSAGHPPHNASSAPSSNPVSVPHTPSSKRRKSSLPAVYEQKELDTTAPPAAVILRAPSASSATATAATATVTLPLQAQTPLLRRRSSNVSSRLLATAPRSPRLPSTLDDTPLLSSLRPAAIDNYEMLAAASFPGELRASAAEGTDFVTVHRAVWQYLQGMYGGGPDIRRRVIERQEGRLEVEVWPVVVTVARLLEGRKLGEAEAVMVSAVIRLGELYERLHERMKVTAEEQMRLWLRTPTNWQLLHCEQPDVLQQTIEQLGWQTGDELMVEVKAASAEAWQLSEKTDGKDWRQVAKGDVLDAKDQHGVWYAASVVDITQSGSHVLVHFHGWSSKWREELPIDSLCTCKAKCACGRRLSAHGLQSRFTVRKSTSAAPSTAVSRLGNTPGKSTPGVCGIVNLGNVRSTSLSAALCRLCQAFHNTSRTCDWLCFLVCQTCYLNCIIQSLSFTPIFSAYFVGGRFNGDLNPSNPLGHRGLLATDFAALLSELWSGQFTAVAPRRLKQTIADFAPQFSGFQQHDAHELLAFLLDGLHEDVNRVKRRVLTAAIESAGRPDKVVARESWEAYRERNKSIVVDLMMGLLKSEVRCPSATCGKTSVTFDCYRYLTVPIPYPVGSRRIHVTLVRADDSACTSYGVGVSEEASVAELKAALSALCGISPVYLIVTEVSRNRLMRVLTDDRPVSVIRPVEVIYVFEALPDVVRPAKPSPSLQSVSSTALELSASTLRADGSVGGASAVTHNQQPVPVVSVTPSQSPFASSSSSSTSSSASSTSAQRGDTVLLTTASSSAPPSATASPSPPPSYTPQPVSSSTRSASPLAPPLALIDDIVYCQTVHRCYLLDGHGQRVLSARFGVPVLLTLAPNTPLEFVHASVWQLIRRWMPPQLDLRPDVHYSLTVLDYQCNRCGLCGEDKSCSGCPLPAASSDSAFRLSNQHALCVLWQAQDDAEQVRQRMLDTHFTRHPTWLSSVQPLSFTLDDCLDAFTAREVLSVEDAWTCAACKQPQQASKQMWLHSTPAVLIIHLKRFLQLRGGRREKIHALVDFPLTALDLRRYLPAAGGDGGGGDGSYPLYDLYAVSNHMGSLTGGHYTAYCRHEASGAWLHFDDQHVHTVQPSAIKTNNAYVLFYRLRQ